MGGVDETKAADESAGGESTAGTPFRHALNRVRTAMSDLFGDRQTFDPYDEVEIPAGVRDHPTRQDVLSSVEDSLAEKDLQMPSEEAIQQRFFDFSYLLGREEVERYWVNEPYAYVSVLRDGGDLKYHVTEPTLTPFESYVREELTKVLRNSLMYHDLPEAEGREEAFRARAREVVDEHVAAVEPVVVHKLLYYLTRDFLRYERVDPIMRDSAVEDISCDGAGVPVFVYHREYRDLDTNIRFDDEDLRSFVVRMAQRAGKHLSVSNPLVDASLPDGSRVQLTFGGDIATRGPNFTVRQFSSVPDTPLDLIKWGTFSIEQMAYFWLAIENNRSLLFAGGTGSGKTTSLNAVSFFIPKKSKVVSIEDTREITLPHDNWVQSLTRESASGSEGVSMYQQLQAALRQRPEYLLVGEIRTQQDVALTFFQAMATGHTAYTTLHSESVTGVINRLENEPLGVPVEMIKELDIISIQKQVRQDAKRVRRNERVAELIAGDGDHLRVNDVFTWDPATDEYNEQFDSRVLQDIAEDRGWSNRRLQAELDRRERVLEYLLKEDITWFQDVAGVIHAFIEDPDQVMDAIESDTLNPARLGDQYR